LTQKLEISVAFDSCDAEKTVDHEHRNFVIHGDDERTLHSRSNVDRMIPFPAVEPKALLLENSDQASLMDEADRGHLAQRQVQTIEGHEFRRPPLVALATVAGFRQNLFQGTEIPIRFQITLNRGLFRLASSGSFPQLDRSSSGT
jgi:hypothetical protein